MLCKCFFFQAEDGIRDLVRSRGLGDVYKRQEYEAYEDMATAKMAQIAREIWARWPMVRGVALVLSLIHI